jgi:hypothetical protein
MRQAPRPSALNVNIFKNSDQEVITKSKNHPTHCLEGRQDVVFHCSIFKQSLHVVGWCPSAHKVSSFEGFCVGPCSGVAQYLGVYPRGTALSTYSIMQEVSLPQIRFVGARDVWPPVSCPDYLVNSMVRFIWGPC